MSAILDWRIGNHLQEVTGSDKLGFGYIMAAYENFQLAGRSGVGQMIRQRYPKVSFETITSPPELPSNFIRASPAPAPPPLRRQSVTHSQATVMTLDTITSSQQSASDKDKDKDGDVEDEALDTLT
jgi:hypothetical protein